ncbi:MAG: PD40 domain-containing protein [Bacteroidetes bacterium]|nr:PD40 domain-containing protein [Bacteroidota bacterium]
MKELKHTPRVEPSHYLTVLFFFSLLLPAMLFAQDDTGIPENKGALKKDAEYFFKEGNYLSALPLYLKLKEMEPDNMEYTYRAGICFLYKSDQTFRAVEFLEKCLSEYPKAKDINYYLGRAYHLNYQFDEAIEQFNKTLESKKTTEPVKKPAQRFLEICNNAKTLVKNKLVVEIENIGPPVNTASSEYFPVITADESMMIFTYRGPKSTGGLMDDYGKPDPRGQYFEDVMVTYKNRDSWSEPQALSDSINTKKHDACIALSADGQKLFTYKDNPGFTSGDIYISNLDSNEWSIPIRLNNINSNAWEGSASISSDLKTIYFASDRPGGFGGRDIYYSNSLPNGEWSMAKNIGTPVNTEYDDDAPFIHPDGRTLYFSSNGHNSMGGYDIFISKLVRKIDTTGGETPSWDSLSWSIPENIGYPINTTDDDKFYVVSANGVRGYYSSARPGGYGMHDIYLVHQNKSHILMMVKGRVYANDEVAEAMIEVTYKENNKLQGFTKGDVQGSYKSNAASGKYLLTLSAGGNYNAGFEVAGFPPHPENFDASKIDTFVEIIKDIDIYSPGYVSRFANLDGQLTAKADSTKPLPGVTVFLKNKTGNVTEQAIADKEGRFRFRKMPKDEQYLLSLSTDKDAIVKGKALSAGKPHAGLKINDTQTREDGTYRLEIKGLQYINIEGDVFYVDKNEPAQFITVFLVSESGNISRQTVTNKEGHFKFEGLPANEKYIISLSTDKNAVVKGVTRSGEKPQKDISLNNQLTDSEGKFSLTVSGEKEFECARSFIELTGWDKIDLNDPKIYEDMLKKYGNVSLEGLIFKVQVGAYKDVKNFNYNVFSDLGKIEQSTLKDGLTRMTIGEFKTLNEAENLKRKARGRGKKDAFITMFCRGERKLLTDAIKTKFGQ